jgi:Phage integrase family
VIRAFRINTKKAGLGEDWVPREMRHTFVSVLSANGVPVESIALLAGHDRTATTESVYRHEIRPALTQGAEMMDKIFARGVGWGSMALTRIILSMESLRAALAVMTRPLRTLPAWIRTKVRAHTTSVSAVSDSL